MAQVIQMRKSTGSTAKRTKGKASTQAVLDRLACDDRLVVQRLISTSDYDCMTDPQFHTPNAQKLFWDTASSIQTPDVSWYVPVLEKLEDTAQANPSVTLLTPDQEKQLFLRFNYCRHRVLEARSKALTGSLTMTLAQEMLLWHQRAQQCQEHIARANLALVLAMIKRMHLVDVDFSDLISEGNLALLRAIDKFNVQRGFKFSTYACRAIIKAFSRFTKKMSRRRQLFSSTFEPDFEKSDHADRVHQDEEDGCVEALKIIIRDNRARLTDVEQKVIHHRFAMPNPDAPALPSEQRPLTLVEVGKLIGVTKERARQIQIQAMEKIRLTLDQQYLD